MNRHQVYIAGFDVFCIDAESVFANIRLEAAMLGMEALVPTDCDLDVGKDGEPAEVASKIRDANIALLRSADAVIANLAPFRGLEPDAGTVYEVGFAHALGLPVVGYGASHASYAARVTSVVECTRDKDGCLREVRNDMAVEDFGLPMNLMLACGVYLRGNPVEALQTVAKLLAKRAVRPSSGSVVPSRSRHSQASLQPSTLEQTAI
jgi:nucleoside 2-deoxyribosyltransferase